MPAEAGPRLVWSFVAAAVAGFCTVADKGLVAALPLSLSARPKEKSRTTHGEADDAPGGS